MDSLSTLPLTVGSGRIKLDVHGQSVHFSELSSTYPLKLLSSRSPGDVNHVALLYLLTYGGELFSLSKPVKRISYTSEGGLVGGDAIRVSAEIGSNARLVILSQVSANLCSFIILSLINP
jgi:urease accessory protein